MNYYSITYDYYKKHGLGAVHTLALFYYIYCRLQYNHTNMPVF